MQTVKGEEGRALVKREFQAAMKYLMLPLIKKDGRRRVAQSAATFSGLPMHEVVAKWKQKFRGCFEGLIQCKWEGKLLEEAKSKAKTAARVAINAVTQLQTKFPALAAPLADPLEAANAAFPPGKGKPLPGCENLLISLNAVYGAFDKMYNLLKQGKYQLAGPYTKLTKAKAALKHVFETLMAYEPCEEPFALAMDNAGAHSMTDDEGNHLPIIPVIQVRF